METSDAKKETEIYDILIRSSFNLSDINKFEKDIKVKKAIENVLFMEKKYGMCGFDAHYDTELLEKGEILAVKIYVSTTFTKDELIDRYTTYLYNAPNENIENSEEDKKLVKTLWRAGIYVSYKLTSEIKMDKLLKEQEEMMKE